MLRHTIHFIIAAVAGSATLSGCVGSPAPLTLTAKPSDEQPVLYDVAKNRINLPGTFSWDAITVRGRDLVVQLPDGSVLVIPNGAIDVPEIWIDGVVIASANFAALLFSEAPEPGAAGPGQPPTGLDPASHHGAAGGSGIRSRSVRRSRTAFPVNRTSAAAAAPTMAKPCPVAGRMLDGFDAA